MKEKVPQHNAEREEYEGGNTGLYDYRKYAQCDYIITRKEHFHMFFDCESRVDIAKNTDRFPIYSKLKTNMEMGENIEDRGRAEQS